MTLPNWNLKKFYVNIDDNKISKDLKVLSKKSKNFSNDFRNKLGSLKASQLIDSLKDFEKIQEIIQKIQSFAYLSYCTNQLDEKNKKFYQQVEEKISEIEKNLIFYGIELNKLSTKQLLPFKKTKYKNWIENHRKFKRFQKSEDNEKLLVEKSITSSSAWVKFFDQTMARLKFLFNGKELTETEILNFLSSTDANIRKKAALVFGKTLKENAFNFCFIMNTISKDLDIDKIRRGFEFSES